MPRQEPAWLLRATVREILAAEAVPGAVVAIRVAGQPPYVAAFG